MSAPAVLARAAAEVEPGLREAVRSLDTQVRRPVEYHFGWVNPDGTPAVGATGKRIRPTLTILGAEAVGGDAQVAIASAVAVELIHNFSLIHDDIMDGDRMRRHRRTVWDVYGIGDAIIIGDALQTLAYEVLLRDSGPRQVAAARRLTAATAAMIAGQAQATALDRSADVTLARCLAVGANKTGALLAESAAIGAVLAGADDEAAGVLERFGVELGVSFQAIDDVLGIWGDPGVTGKPVGSDIGSRKKSIPVAIALDAGGSLANDVRRTFEGEISEAAVVRLSAQLNESGIKGTVEELARVHLAAALAALRSRSFDACAAAELEELARFVVARTF